MGSYVWYFILLISDMRHIKGRSDFVSVPNFESSYYSSTNGTMSAEAISHVTAGVYVRIQILS